ncbi:SWIM zinc finger family protein [Streptomyces ovatisporus]|uniref:SWIM zinc finger family protein n=1 Tax=Streptomyces ovatisporus TaxID=1128682 RepID=A0ABV9AF69_9ACTN
MSTGYGSADGGRPPGRRDARRDGADGQYGAVPGRRTRGLAPLPPRPGTRGPFAETWWGNAWVRALEESSLDAGRLSRGRTYARGGHVGTITVTPGRIAAPVRGSRPRPYRTVIRLRAFTDREWDAFLDAVTAQPAHIAALLDKDMPRELVGAAESAGVRLLPGPGEVDPGCSCPDSGRPCKHAAALCYQTARFLDADPFVLLLVRGREEEELLDELARRNAALNSRGTARAESTAYGAIAGDARRTDDDSARSGSAPAGVLAREALATSVRPPLPEPLPPPPAPGQPPVLPELPGAPDPSALSFLATDAANRAHAALSDPDSLRPLPGPSDAVRLAATHPGLTGRGTLSARFATLARGTGHTAVSLARAAAAWRQGAEGPVLLETSWDPPAGNFDRARGAFAAAGLPRMSIDRNRLTDPSRTCQLRYGEDDRWYPYRNEGGPGAKGEHGDGEDWWPDGPSDADPVAALTTLLEGG